MVTKAAAKQKIRRVTRRAVAKGMTQRATKQGLSITKNEGSAALQRAVAKIGYQKSKALVNRTKKRSR